jgi:glycosyltransferase involved in cell wall biosynthesis
LKSDAGHPLDWVSFRLARFKEKQIHRLYERHLANRPGGFETYAMARLPYPTPVPTPNDLSETQIVHLHWISFFLDYPSFFDSIPDSVPVVWTLHDTSAFTGGCHFVSGCGKFKSGCGSCPQIQRPGPNDVSRNSFEAKKEALKKKTVHVVSPSEWLMQMAKASPVWPANTQFHKIHYGLDLKKFRPSDQAAARRELGLPTEKKLIAFGAANVTNERKGFSFLADALAKIQHKLSQEVECVVFGSGKMEFSRPLPPVHSMGYIDCTNQLNKIYSAADMVVVPSVEDNQPQTGLEAMACGTPVVAFNAGGIPEFVRHEQTGLLARSADSDDLAKQMTRLVKDSNLRRRLSEAARSMMEMEFETETQAWQHLILYRDILKSRTANDAYHAASPQSTRKRAA